MQILLRPADPDGLAYFEMQLQLGMPRKHVLRLLRASDEAKSIYETFTRSDLLELLNLDNDLDFLAGAYKLYLARPIDPDGSSYYLKKIKDGKSRKSILVELIRSDEFNLNHPLFTRRKKIIMLMIYKISDRLGLFKNDKKVSQLYLHISELNSKLDMLCDKCTQIDYMTKHINNEIYSLKNWRSTTKFEDEYLLKNNHSVNVPSAPQSRYL